MHRQENTLSSTREQKWWDMEGDAQGHPACGLVVLSSVLDLDAGYTNSSPLLVTGRSFLLTGTNCPPQCRHNDSELRNKTSPSYFMITTGEDGAKLWVCPRSYLYRLDDIAENFLFASVLRMVKISILPFSIFSRTREQQTYRGSIPYGANTSLWCLYCPMRASCQGWRALLVQILLQSRVHCGICLSKQPERRDDRIAGTGPKVLWRIC